MTTAVQHVAPHQRETTVDIRPGSTSTMRENEL
jgi:hypothetical protein